MNVSGRPNTLCPLFNLWSFLRPDFNYVLMHRHTRLYTHTIAQTADETALIPLKHLVCVWSQNSSEVLVRSKHVAKPFPISTSGLFLLAKLSGFSETHFRWSLHSALIPSRSFRVKKICSNLEKEDLLFTPKLNLKMLYFYSLLNHSTISYWLCIKTDMSLWLNMIYTS